MEPIFSLTALFNLWASTLLAPLIISGILCICILSLAMDKIPYATITGLHLVSLIFCCLMTSIAAPVILHFLLQIFAVCSALKLLGNFLTLLGRDDTFLESVVGLGALTGLAIAVLVVATVQQDGIRENRSVVEPVGGIEYQGITYKRY
jgi:hypothetical protein